MLCLFGFGWLSGFFVDYFLNGVSVGTELLFSVMGLVLEAGERIGGIVSDIFSEVFLGGVAFDEPYLFFEFAI